MEEFKLSPKKSFRDIILPKRILSPPPFSEGRARDSSKRKALRENRRERKDSLKMFWIFTEEEERFLFEKKEVLSEIEDLLVLKRLLDKFFEKEKGTLPLLISLYQELRNVYLLPEAFSLLSEKDDCSPCQERKLDLVLNFFTKNKDSLRSVEERILKLSEKISRKKEASSE